MRFYLTVFVVALVLAFVVKYINSKPVVPTDSAYVEKRISKGTALLDKKIRTIYKSNGLPINRGFDGKGFHRVSGKSTLVSGVDTVTLNTDVGGGKSDISFSDSLSYWGRAWAASLAHRANTYSILPLTGSKFVVVSSSDTDTAAVNYSVEGD